MKRLFGTDGVRGVANHDLTPDLALALGRAAGRVLAPSGGRVVVGRDTRVSGPMLEAALVAGSVLGGGRRPASPASSRPRPSRFSPSTRGASGGVMISASHNPVPDNGIKFFSHEGLKIPEDVEDAIESAVADPPTDLPGGRPRSAPRPTSKMPVRSVRRAPRCVPWTLHSTGFGSCSIARSAPR